MKKLTDIELKKAIDKPIFRLISQTADRLGLDCYVIGGFVRDLFLERPSTDVDFVVINQHHGDGQDIERPGIAIAKALKDEIGKKASLSVFKNFGTAQLKIKNVELEDREAGLLSDFVLECFCDCNTWPFDVLAIAVMLVDYNEVNIC